jgi:hypothetical protein
MQFEGVRSISLSDGVSKTLRQVDDFNGLERALFSAETTTDTKSLRKKADLALRPDFDALFALSVQGASFLALLATLFRFALVRVDDSDSKLVL